MAHLMTVPSNSISSKNMTAIGFVVFVLRVKNARPEACPGCRSVASVASESWKMLLREARTDSSASIRRCAASASKVSSVRTRAPVLTRRRRRC